MPAAQAVAVPSRSVVVAAGNGRGAVRVVVAAADGRGVVPVVVAVRCVVVRCVLV